MARRVVALLLLCVLVGAAGLAASHGHLSGRDHAQTCASCTAADARVSLIAPPATPPAPLPLADAPHLALVTLSPAPRPPLQHAPKHGPPALV